MNREFLTIANIISIFRIYLTIPIVYFSWLGPKYHLLLLVLIIIAYISDALDGFLARKLNQVSDWGKILDPLGDKILSTALVITFYNKGLFSLFFVILVILRDLFISLFSTKIVIETNIVIQASIIGKITTLTLSILYSISLLYLMNYVNFQQLKKFEIISMIMVIISGLYYLLVFIKSTKTLKNNKN